MKIVLLNNNIELNNKKYAARQKEVAAGSVTELVEAVKKQPRPRALSESANRPFMRKSEGAEPEKFAPLASAATATQITEMKPPARRHSHAGTRSTMQSIVELPEAEKKPKKPNRRLSFLG